jgi:carbon storage regulator
MLILSRRPGDAILIDGGIRIVVLAADSGSVRLGIEAPSQVGIVREEIVDRIADENRRSGATADAKGWLEELEPRSGTKDEPTEDQAQDEPEG